MYIFLILAIFSQLLTSAVFAENLAVDPSSPAIKSNQGIELFKTKVIDNPKDYLSLVILANLYLSDARRRGDLSSYNLAESVARQALTAKAEYVPAKLALMRALMGFHQFAEALQLAKNALLLDDSDDAVKIAMSDALFETGDYDNANQIIETLQKNFEGEPSILYRQARMFELHGDNKHAIGNLKRAVASIDSSTAEDSESKSWYHLQLGERYVRIGNLKSAEAEYQIALKLAPNSGFPLEHLAEIAAILKQYDRAQQLFLDATKLTPRPDLIQAQGDIAAAKGDNQLATEFFKRAKEAYEKGNSDERSPYDHHLTGLYADSLADPEKAIFYARKDLNARKTLGTYDALAWALFRAGKYEEAKSMIDKATQWGTQDGHLLYHASMIYGANGDLEKSSELLKSAKAITAYVNSFHIHR